MISLIFSCFSYFSTKVTGEVSGNSNLIFFIHIPIQSNSHSLIQINTVMLWTHVTIETEPFLFFIGITVQRNDWEVPSGFLPHKQTRRPK